MWEPQLARWGDLADVGVVKASSPLGPFTGGITGCLGLSDGLRGFATEAGDTVRTDAMREEGFKVLFDE
jgi:hypothetical protein